MVAGRSFKRMGAPRRADWRLFKWIARARSARESCVNRPDYFRWSRKKFLRRDGSRAMVGVGNPARNHGVAIMADVTTNDLDETIRSVAIHEFIAAPGGEKVAIEQAKGIRYTDRASGEKFEFFPNEKAVMLCALFGAKTKATNETSRVRQRNGDSAAQLEALDEVFESINNGVWREKAEGGGGSRTDKGVLADVLIEMLGTTAKGDRAHYVKRFEDDVAYMRKVLASDAGTKYRERMGKKGPAVDTLA